VTLQKVPRLSCFWVRSLKSASPCSAVKLWLR
jgi:hypothetical protein